MSSKDQLNSGFDLLLNYAQLSREYAKGLPQQETIVEYWTGVGFTLGENRFVVPMNEVAEILSMPKFTKVPGVKSWVCGVANVRGRLLPVVDMMAFFDKSSSKITRRRRMLLLERGELYSGVLVDDVLGMQHFPLQNYLQEVGDESEALISEHLIGTYWRDSEEKRGGIERWPIFSLYRMAENPKFLQFAG